MPSLLRLLALLVLAFLGASATSAAPCREARARQQPGATGEPDRGIAARERYLLTNPWHPRVFQEYREGLVERGDVDARADDLTARGRAGEPRAGILAARLRAAAGELEGARLLLAEFAPDDEPRAALLRAEWSERAGRGEDAAREVEAALAALAPGEERERALQLALDLALQQGSRAACEAALARALAESPDDLELRLELVDELLRAGWPELSGEVLDGARELAATRPESPESALAVHLAEARVAAARGDAAGAARAQRTALERLGRDHWRRPGLRAAAIEAARAAGTLAAWREELARRVEQAQSLAAFEDLAAIELQLGRPDVAWDVLARAAARDDADDDLRAARLALAGRTGRTDEAIALLQDEVERHGRPASSLELADALFAAGRVEAARAQWDRCAVAAGDDATRLAEVASRRAQHGEDAPVVTLLERVATLAAAFEPDTTAPADADPGRGLLAALELARHHARHGRPDAALRVLDAASDARAGDAAALEELGAVCLELGDAARAETRWRAALALRVASSAASDPGAGERSGPARLARRLARLQQEAGRLADARATLEPFVERELREDRGSVTLLQLLGAYPSRDELRVAAERAARRALAGEGGRTAWYLAAEGRARAGDAQGALELWRRYVADAPDDLAALESLGGLEVQRGELDAAAETLARLEASRPTAGRDLRARLGRAFGAAGDRRRSLATLSPLARNAAPRELAGLVRVLLDLGAVEEALETRRRAASLGADDLETRLALAAGLTGAGRLQEAREELRAAYRLAPEERRAPIVATLAREALPAGPEREAWIGELLRDARRRPLDGWAWCLVADLRLDVDEPRAAREVLDEALAGNAARPALLWRRARAAEALGRPDAALEDLRRARLLGDEEPPEAAELELRALLAEGRSADALARALASDRPLVTAAILRQHGEHAAAVEVLEAARRPGTTPGASVEPDGEVELQLGELYLALGRVEPAIEAFERRLRLGPPDLRLLERLGDLYAARGDAEAVLAVGGRLLAASPRAVGARDYFARHGRVEDWIRLACARALERGPDAATIAELDEELRKDPRGVRALQGLYADISEAARREGRAPEGWAAPAWALACADAERDLLRTWPAVLAGRCEDVRERLRDPAPLSAREWIEAAFVVPASDAIDVERLARALRAAADPEESTAELRDPVVAAALARLGIERPAVARELARHAARLANRLDGGDLGDVARRERERREVDLVLAKAAPDARVAALVVAGRPASGALAWLDPDLLRRHAALAAAAAGDASLEADLDRALSSAAATRLAALLALLETDVARGRHAAASRGLARLAERVPERTDAALDLWARAGEAYRRAGAVAAGYAAFRRLGRDDAARALVRDDAERARCIAAFDAEARAARGALAGPAAATAEAEAAERALHEATVLLLDFLPAGGAAREGAPSGRGATLRALEVLPDDAVLRAQLAREEELAGRFAEALEERERALVAVASGRPLDGLEPLDRARAVGDVRRASAWLILESEADFAGALRLGALRMQLELGRPATLATLDAWLARGTPPGPTTPTLLLHLLAGYELGAGLADHLAAVFARYPEHGTILRELLTELCAQARFDEARAALDDHLGAVPEPGAAAPRVARLRERVDRLAAGSR